MVHRGFAALGTWAAATLAATVMSLLAVSLVMSGGAPSSLRVPAEARPPDAAPPAPVALAELTHEDEPSHGDAVDPRDAVEQGSEPSTSEATLVDAGASAPQHGSSVSETAATSQPSRPLQHAGPPSEPWTDPAADDRSRWERWDRHQDQDRRQGRSDDGEERVPPVEGDRCDRSDGGPSEADTGMDPDDQGYDEAGGRPDREGSTYGHEATDPEDVDRARPHQQRRERTEAALT